MIRFVIPAYNERENIPRLLADLAPVARELGARVIFVDDGSTDGTAEAIAEHSDASAPRRRPPHRQPRARHRHQLRPARRARRVLRRRRRSSRSRPTTPPTSPTCRACSSCSRRAPTSCSPPSTRPAGASSASRPGGWPPPKPSPTPSATPAACARSTHSPRSTASTAPAPCAARPETYGYLLVREPGFAANVELLLKLYNAGARVERGAHGQRLVAAHGRSRR